MRRTLPHCTTLRILLSMAVLAALAGALPYGVRSADTASLSLSPSSGSETVGNTFTVKLRVNTGGQPINAAEATIHFSKDTLDAKSVAKSGSIFSLWAVEPTISNSAGTITFSGGLPSPGYTGSSGTILTITFLAQAEGTATLSISNAQVLANDGLGTDILGSSGTATFTIKKAQPTNTAPLPPAKTFPAPTIASTAEPDQGAWYAQNTLDAHWSAGSGVLGYTAVFDQNATTESPDRGASSTTIFSRTGVADGVWYMHVRAQYADGWSDTAHFAFHIDTAPPQDFALTVSHALPTDREATVTFAATDAGSGIDHYTLSLDAGGAQTAVSPVTLKDLAEGGHDVLVKAYDKAGNAKEAKAHIDVTLPEAPLVILATPSVPVLGLKIALPTFVAGTPLVLRGFAKLTDHIKIVVHSTESVFDFPVSDILDPNPVQPAPQGQAAWKVEILPDVTPGDHEIRVTTKDANGVESSAAPVIRFHVVNNVARFGNTLLPFPFLLKILFGLASFFFLTTVVLFVLFLRLHRSRLHRKAQHAKEPMPNFRSPFQKA